MKCKVLSMTAMLVVSSLFIGCSSATERMDFTPVSVRFVIPPEPEALAQMDVDSEARLATDASYDGFADPNATPTSASDVYHVALWGDAFTGQDVTRGVTSLQPGAYTFAFVDREHQDMMQGWLEINGERYNMLDFLYTWKSQIPQQKRQLAYDFELRYKTDRGDADVFKGFTKEVEAFDRLDRQLDKMIKEEVSAQRDWKQRTHQLFQNAELRILPGGEPVFHPATRAAFTDNDMSTVRNGNPITKFVLLADHADTHWKLQRVNQLYNEWKHCKAVMQEAANRFERQKGLFLLTDHLHPDDSRFVDNEIRLQTTLEIIERLDEQMADLRNRRLALAFTSGLIAPKDHFRALNEEEQDLMRERVVLDTEARRLDLLIEKADESQIKRVALERDRQRVMAALHDLDQHIEDLWAAHRSLETMIASKSVIHRQGDQRLLAATLVGGGLPYPVRQAVEREAVMTVRLEKSDSVFIPTETGGEGSVTRAKQSAQYQPRRVVQRQMQPQPQRAYYSAPPVTQRTTSVRHGKVTPRQKPAVVSTRTNVKKQQPVRYQRQVASQQKTNVQQRKPAQFQPRKLAHQDMKVQPKQVAPQGKRWAAKRHADTPKVKSEYQVAQSLTPQKTTVQQRPLHWYKGRPVERQSPKVAQDLRTQSKRTFQPKARFARQYEPQQPQPKVQFARQYEPQQPQPRHQAVGPDDTQVKRHRGCQLPWFIQMFVPPCWFVESWQKEARVVDYKEPTTWQKEDYRATGTDQAKTQGCQLPWFIKILVPPCWFVESWQREARVVDYKEPMTWQKKDYRAKGTDQAKTQGCQLPWFIKILVPPCWFVDQWHKDTQVADYDKPHTPQRKAYRTADTDHGKKQTCGLPWFVKVLVPPCWFAEPVQKDANLVGYKDTTWQKRDYEKPVDQTKEDKGCELPWFMQVLVPPCWFVD